MLVCKTANSKTLEQDIEGTKGIDIHTTELISFPAMYMYIAFPPFQSHTLGCLRRTVIQCWLLTGELSLSCARPTADG